MSYKFDLIIKNGNVIDGTGGAGEVKDIGICNDKIEYIGNLAPPFDCNNIIDASGHNVTPGFIDIHSHSDFFWLVNPESECKIFDGVTTEICGNCGISAFPLKGQLLENKKKGFSKFKLDINWQTAGDFFEMANDTPSSINRGFLVGHGNVRSCVLGYEGRKPNKIELVNMQVEVREAMEAGALGISSGLVYPPGCYAETSELIELCKVVEKYNGIYTTHIRGEGDTLETSIDETIGISRESGVNTQISHIKTWGKRNWGKLEKIKYLLDNARSKGMKISCDRYPYIASATDLEIILPNWVFEGGPAEEKKRLKDPSCRKRIVLEMANKISYQGYWESIVISSVFKDDRKDYEGKTVAELTKTLKKSPLEFVLDLLIDEDCRVSVLLFVMSENNLDKILGWDYVMIGSDSSLRTMKGPLNYGKPHPRCYGTFSRVIRKYANEKGLFSIEEAIHKMTGMPARKLRLEKRGIIKEGYFADITIFDKDTIADKATFTDPHHYSEGIKHVIVNGQITVKNGKHTGVVNGNILKGV